jgi:hypothetical protein
LRAAVALLAAVTACSAGPETPVLPRPDPPGTRLPPAARLPAEPACAEAGAVLTGEAQRCCDGLGAAPFYLGSVIRLDQCQLEGKGRSTCIRCGDGRCGQGENACNCPADCPM